MPSKKKKYNARFPAGRIKKIMQSDEEVGKVAQAVPIIISRTLELFVESLLQKTLRITKTRNAKTLSPSHMRQCIMSENRFDFLRELVKNVPDINVEEAGADGAAGVAVLPPGIAGSSMTGGGTGAGRSIARRRATDSATSDDVDDDDDDDVEFVSGPTDLSRATMATTASSSNGHKRNAYGGEPVATSHQSSYASGLPQQNHQSRLQQQQPQQPQPPPQQFAVDLAPASGAAGATRSFAANYYTEIDASYREGSSNNTVATSQSAKSSPTGGEQPATVQAQALAAASAAAASQLHRSASTPSANFYMETQPTQQQQQRPINLTPVAAPAVAVEKLQPPIINFDFSRGLENSAIRITAPNYSSSSSSAVSHNSSAASAVRLSAQPVPTTVVNVAIDQLTMTPLVKIDYSQLMSATAAEEAAAAAAAVAATTSAAAAAAASRSIVAPEAAAAAALLQKPRRGRPPKIRAEMQLQMPSGAVAAMPAAPASAPVRHSAAFAPYTPTAAPRHSHRAAAAAAAAQAGNTTTTLFTAKSTTAKYQKSASSTTAIGAGSAKKSRRASSGGGQQQQMQLQQQEQQSYQSYHHHQQHSVSAAAQTLLNSSASNVSCLDMDEDYDNI